MLSFHFYFCFHFSGVNDPIVFDQFLSLWRSGGGTLQACKSFQKYRAISSISCCSLRCFAFSVIIQDCKSLGKTPGQFRGKVVICQGTVCTCPGTCPLSPLLRVDRMLLKKLTEITPSKLTYDALVAAPLLPVSVALFSVRHHSLGL